MKTITFIINPISGTKKKHEIPGIIADTFKGSGITHEIVYTERAGHATEIAAQKAQEGVDVVVAVGGDGTVNEVAKALVHTNTALGIVPCGSGNGLARHLGVPMNRKKSIQLFLDGTVETIDHGKINGERLFFCSCGVGFDALVSWKFAQAPKRGLSTYCKIALKEKLNYKPESYILRTDTGEEMTYQAFVIACGNAAQYGNDAFIAPYASAQDGKLDVTVIQPINFLDAMSLGIRLFAKKIDKHRKVKVLRCQKITLIREKEGAMHFDGEPIMAPKDLEIEIIKGGLKVFIPKNQTV